MNHALENIKHENIHQIEIEDQRIRKTNVQIN